MALPTYKDIVDLLKKGATVEAQEKIMALRETALELQEENIELKQKIKELEDALELKGKVVWEDKDPYYFIIDKDGKKNGPYCQLCYDNSPPNNRKFIRLQNTRAQGSWTCCCCKNSFYDSSYVLQPPRQVRFTP